MKNLKITFLGMVVFFLASCGSDTTADLLPGSWNLTSIAATNCGDPTDNITENYGPDSCEDFGGVEYCTSITWNFEPDNVLTANQASTEDGVEIENDNNSGTYTILEDDSMVRICFDGECFTGTIVISESVMTWSTTQFDCSVLYSFSK